jgi:uncharacterized OB-fold protein
MRTSNEAVLNGRRWEEPVTTAEETKRPLPHPSELTQPFWDATREHKLVMQRCTNCGTWTWLPQPVCRKCLTPTLEWTPTSGRGTVYTYVIMHRSTLPSFTAPYVIAVVELEEGTRFFTNIVGCDPKDVKIGMPVEVRFNDQGEVSLPEFAPRS